MTYKFDPTKDSCPRTKDSDKRGDAVARKFDASRHFDIKQFAGKDYITGGQYQKYKASDKVYKRKMSMLWAKASEYNKIRTAEYLPE